MLATLTGLQGGAHNGLGKGFGGLLGGFTIASTHSTHKAFRYFGFTCAGVSVFYTISVIILIIRRRRRSSTKERRHSNGDGQESEKVVETYTEYCTELKQIESKEEVDALLEDENGMKSTDRESPIGGDNDDENA